MSSGVRGSFTQMWNDWWNPQAGTRPERLRVWCREYFKDDNLPAGVGGQGPTPPRTEEEQLRTNLGMLRVANAAIAVIWLIAAVALIGDHFF
jgi:hypothetical protein